MHRWNLYTYYVYSIQGWANSPTVHSLYMLQVTINQCNVGDGNGKYCTSAILGDSVLTISLAKLQDAVTLSTSPQRSERSNHLASYAGTGTLSALVFYLRTLGVLLRLIKGQTPVICLRLIHVDFQSTFIFLWRSLTKRTK